MHSANNNAPASPTSSHDDTDAQTTQKHHKTSERSAHSRLDRAAVQARVGSPASMVQALRLVRPVLEQLVRHQAHLAAAELDDSDVDDLVQELWVAFWTIEIQRYDITRGSLRVFLGRRVGWRVRDLLRARGRRTFASFDTLKDEGLEVEAQQQQPPELLAMQAHEEQVARVPVVLELILGGDQAARTAIVRADLEGRPLREVALELNVHVSNASRARTRGLQKLQHAFAA